MHAPVMQIVYNQCYEQHDCLQRPTQSVSTDVNQNVPSLIAESLHVGAQIPLGEATISRLFTTHVSAPSAALHPQGAFRTQEFTHRADGDGWQENEARPLGQWLCGRSDERRGAACKNARRFTVW